MDIVSAISNRYRCVDINNHLHMYNSSSSTYFYDLPHSLSSVTAAGPTIPNDWKYLNITPIFKKGLRSPSAYYRPISLI